jgi:ribose transport system ATP-binding protein
VGLGGLLGAGRSETAKAVVGAFPLESGGIVVSGKRLGHRTTAAALKAGVALLSEDRKVEGIIPNLSVRENIVLAALPRLSRRGLVSRAKQDRVVELFMKRLRIKASSPDQRVSDLSGGNQQKDLLARWLCTEPKVLLLDEPTRGIDVGAKAEVQILIKELADEGLGVVLISSELEELLEGSDRVVVLKDGAVVGTLERGEVDEGALMRMLAVESPAGEPDGSVDADGSGHGATVATGSEDRSGV